MIYPKRNNFLQVLDCMVGCFHVWSSRFIDNWLSCWILYVMFGLVKFRYSSLLTDLLYCLGFLSVGESTWNLCPLGRGVAIAEVRILESKSLIPNATNDILSKYDFSLYSGDQNLSCTINYTSNESSHIRLCIQLNSILFFSLHHHLLVSLLGNGGYIENYRNT